MFSRIEFLIEGFRALFFLAASYVFKNFPPSGSLSAKFASVSLSAKTDLSDHVVIVTGSNTGIGKQSALQLAALGATVVLACRSEEKGENAAREINAHLATLAFVDFPNAARGRAVFMKLDLLDLHAVLDFAKRFKERFSRLDVLVNNAGLNSEGLLVNGLQQLFQVNYLGHYLLVRALEDLLRCPKTTARLGEFRSSAGRVVNLSSVMHHGGQANFKASALRKLTRSMRSRYSYYDDSKLYMNLLTLEINRRFGALSETSPGSAKVKRPILAISANPGAVSSDIWRNMPFQTLWKAVMSLLFLNTQQGAATTVCAATMQESCIAEYQRTFQQAQDVGKGMQIRGDVPYFIPYYMPFTSLCFELLGAFAGPKLGAVSLPQHSALAEELKFERERDQELLSVRFDSPEDLAKQLWDFSGSLCHKILIQSGVAHNEVEFLL